jgi:hypothetical protein
MRSQRDLLVRRALIEIVAGVSLLRLSAASVCRGLGTSAGPRGNACHGGGPDRTYVHTPDASRRTREV